MKSKNIEKELPKELISLTRGSNFFNSNDEVYHKTHKLALPYLNSGLRFCTDYWMLQD